MGGFQGYDPSCFKVFFDKGFACFHLCWVERIDFGDLGGEVRVKVDGMVIGVMWRELIIFSEKTSAKSLHHSGMTGSVD